MNPQWQTQPKVASIPKTSLTSFMSIQGGLLQRKCACGGTAGIDDACAVCRKKHLTLPPMLSSGLPSIALPKSQQTGSGLGYSHDFANLPVHPIQQTMTSGKLVHKNAPEDAEPLDEEEPSSGGAEAAVPGQFLPTEAPTLPPIGAGESAPDVLPLDKGSETKAKCPTKTVVETVTDMTPEGIKKGYRTGYGAVSTMKVEPDATNWDGVPIVESLKQTKNDCPKEFGIAPCSGNSTFTVGAEGNSSVLGKLPATQNRFYDFHISRWNKGSLLHDRNPANLNSCSVECEQTYACGGNLIGKHTVTRTFTKGTSGSRDVTLVAVTKK